jgi:hypothetical protein
MDRCRMFNREHYIMRLDPVRQRETPPVTRWGLGVSRTKQVYPSPVAIESGAVFAQANLIAFDLRNVRHINEVVLAVGGTAL